MNITERLLRERNIEAIFDRSEELRGQIMRGIGMLCIGIIAGRIAAGYWTFANLLVAMLAAVCIMLFILGVTLCALARVQLSNLPDLSDHEPPPSLPVMQQETRPTTIRVEHVRDNQMQIRPVDLDMEQSELDEFALAIRNNRDGLIGRMAITKRLIKNRTNIKNVDGRYRHWFRQLREAGAIQDISGTWYLTEVGEAILDELSPTP